MGVAVVLAIGLRSAPAGDPAASSGFEVAVESAERALAAKDLPEATRQALRALERDARSPRAWDLRARVAEAAGDRDEHVYARHRELALRLAQGAPRKEVQALRKRLEALDPLAKDTLALGTTFVDRLLRLAKDYRKAKRPHSAIRVYQQVLALDPERAEAQAAIEEISAAPDPSLAATAKPKDLLADVSAEWIRAFDREHGTWEVRAKLERENYTTYTDAGYEVMVRCAEAMEQMNAFYRVFFRYGHDDGKAVPRIDLNIFKERDTYLKLGIGPPVDWSKGHFTGGAVEVWIGDSGFDAMTGTLFHEAAHQFVSLATNAVGWLNEGLACFFEGCRILPNGTVLVNRPATGRLFSLAGRMEKGWMASPADGIDPADPSKSRPPKAPTFRILIENDYAWGPPWYAPTWGLVYYLYNVQDPLDGRFLYRDAFRDYIDTSGGKTGKQAIQNFEKVVLGNPKPLTRSLRKKEDVEVVELPRTVDEVDAHWKRWILALRDEQRGSLKVARPYLDWARYAIEREDMDEAEEHLERGARETPRDVDLLEAFAAFLAKERRNKDRAAKLLHQALAVLEGDPAADPKRVAALEARLSRLDRAHRNLSRIHRDLERGARDIAERYLEQELYLMAMHVSAALGTKLGMPGMLHCFRRAVEASGKTLALWQLAYNEQDLRGWATEGSRVFQPYGAFLRAAFGEYAPDTFAYSFLTMDTVTDGDLSVEAEVLAEKGESAFAGLVFGRKGGAAFHAMILFPEGYVDLASFYAAGSYETWRHEAVEVAPKTWHRLRVDLVGRDVDVWLDGRLLASQSFPSREVLAGRFGLLTGPGKAQFRGVRYLARDPADPGGRIERELRLARATQDRRGRLGYHMGTVPPWPRPKAWIQAPRASWDERGLVPTLVVLWSMRQNDVMPLEGWLTHLAEAYADTGLEVVSVSEDAEPDAVRAYLASHSFPGSVAVDDFDPTKGGAGTTMDLYAAGRNGYPWVLLLDIDQKVVWEGNPGFFADQPWQPGVKTHVDAPLADLVKRRNLTQLRPWMTAWAEQAPEAIARGDMVTLLPLLVTAGTLPGDLVARVAEGQRLLRSLHALLADLPAALEAVEAAGMEAALPHLVAWAGTFELEIDPDLRKQLERAMRAGHARAWQSTLRQVELARERLEKGKPPAEVVARLREKIADRKDAPTAALAADLEAALAAGDDAMARTLADAPDLPVRWLLHAHLGWGR